MAQSRRRFPAGPVAVSVLLVLFGLAYMVRRGGEGIDLVPAAEGVVRVVACDLAEVDAGIAGESLCNVLLRLNADVACLGGLTSAELVSATVECLGPGWTAQTVPGPEGRHVAVLAGPRLRAEEYHLVPTPSGDAVALTLRRPDRPVFHAICAHPASDMGDGERARYVAGILGWHDAHPAALTVLAGRVDAEGAERQRLADRFTDICVGDGQAAEIRLAPAGAKVDRSGRLNCVIDGRTFHVAVVDTTAP